MKLHPDPTPTKGHSFDLQSESLFLARSPRQGDPAAGADDPVPRQSVPSLQCPDGQARRAGKPGGLGHVAVRDDLAPGNAGDDPSKKGESAHDPVPRPLTPTGDTPQAIKVP